MRLLKFFTLGIVALLAGGALYQRIARTRERQQNPVPGVLVDVGGYRMHLYCTGEGSPAVILDAGLGESRFTWSTLQPRVAQFTRVCSYDRAGMGWSDPSPRQRTSKTIAEELHVLLHNGRAPEPYVLVGHSFGGWNVRMYASLYRGEVAGMTLIDASHPDQLTRLPAEIFKQQARYTALLRAFEFTMPFGLPRLMGFCQGTPEERAATCSADPPHEVRAELAAMAESAAEVRATGPFGDLPIRILSHDPERIDGALFKKGGPDVDLAKQANLAWEQMQRELTGLSSNSARVVATGSGHYIHVDKPDVVIAAIREVAGR